MMKTQPKYLWVGLETISFFCFLITVFSSSHDELMTISYVQALGLHSGETTFGLFLGMFFGAWLLHTLFWRLIYAYGGNPYSPISFTIAAIAGAITGNISWFGVVYIWLEVTEFLIHFVTSRRAAAKVQA